VPKQEWSEEDKKKIDRLITYFKGKDNKEFTEWFSLLKDRVIPQPKQEWSEEDEGYFNSIAHALSVCLIDPSFDEINLGHTAWFKSLKDKVQPHSLTVTDEELAQAKKDAYNDVLDKIEYHSGEPTFDDGWSAAIWYLKKRNAQPQNRWKPSDEQVILKQRLKVCTNEDIDMLNNIINDLTDRREMFKNNGDKEFAADTQYEIDWLEKLKQS
jgi:hypothetical protein